MYGESFGTGTLTDELAMIAQRIRADRDDGKPADEGMLDDARWLMEGAMVLWTRIMEEVHDGQAS